MTKELLTPRKWLALEQANDELMEIGIMLEMATNAAAEFEDAERLPYVITIACRRLHDIRQEIKSALEVWQASGDPYLDEGANDEEMG